MKLDFVAEREGYIEVIVLEENGRPIDVFIRCNRSTLKSAMKKAGYAHLLPRGFVK
jgi:hypothetical protein